MKKTNSMLESILEEVERNPILTETELKDMLYFPSEDEIREEELMTETICKKIEIFQEENCKTPSKKQLRKIIAEERIKRNLL